MEIIFCGNTIPVDHITTNFCTCHYSTAVVSGAKFCRDNFLWTRAEWYFRWNLNCDGKIVSGMDPCSVIKLTFKSEHGWVINSCIELWDVITYPFPILRWTLTLKEAPPGTLFWGSPDIHQPTGLNHHAGCTCHVLAPNRHQAISNQYTNSTLTHCGLMTPFGDTDLGQHWLR